MPYHFNDSVVMIFCKAPVPGQVKTRLTPALSEQQACDLHIELSRRILGVATQRRLCPVQLWCSPTIKHDFFSNAAANYGVSLHLQHGADLGARMHQAFCSALSQYKHALLIGCDCPSLTAADLENGFTVLQQNADLVLSPAEDGGYVLIGLNQAQPTLFSDINWGGTEVFAQTLSRSRLLQLRYHELTTQWDVDTISDLARYRRLLAQ